MEGKYEATFIRAVDQLRASKLGARIMELPTMAMIEGVTLTTTTTYVQNHEDEARSLIMAMVNAIHFFKTKKSTRWPSSKNTARSCSEYRTMRSGTVFTRRKLPPSRLSLIRA